MQKIEMKVAHIYWSLKLGGIETMLVNIVNEQALKLQSVHLIIINDDVDDELLAKVSNRVHIKLLKRRKGSFPLITVIKLNWYLKLNKIDIVHSHYNGIINFLLPTRNYKTCVTLHAISQPKNSSELHRYSRIFAISQSVQQSLKVLRHLDSIVVYNGIDFSMFKAKKIITKSNRFRIVAIGRLLHEIKGQDLLIEAISYLEENEKKLISVDIIGGGPSENYLRNLIKKCDIDKCVHLLGEKSQQYISSHLCEYDLFVQPSYREGFGLTVVEAMASKVPVLVSENQGPLEIINNGEYGYKFTNGDALSLANAIREILHNGDFSKKVENAYKYALSNYDIKQTSNRYIEEYKAILL